MTSIYILSDPAEIVGTYTTLKGAKTAIEQYLTDLQDDPDAFEELVVNTIQPFTFTIRKNAVDAHPASTPDLLEKYITVRKAYVHWNNQKNSCAVNYKLFTSLPQSTN